MLPRHRPGLRPRRRRQPAPPQARQPDSMDRRHGSRARARRRSRASGRARPSRGADLDALVADLNAIIQGPSIWKPKRFADRTLTAEAIGKDAVRRPDRRRAACGSTGGCSTRRSASSSTTPRSPSRTGSPNSCERPCSAGATCTGSSAASRSSTSGHRRRRAGRLRALLGVGDRQLDARARTSASGSRRAHRSSSPAGSASGRYGAAVDRRRQRRSSPPARRVAKHPLGQPRRHREMGVFCAHGSLDQGALAADQARRVPAGWA